MDQKAGAQISQRAFIQSLVILFVLMMIAGILTLVVPAGGFSLPSYNSMIFGRL
jgi:uncharacterized ion transporter superfamily protein YfcC